MRTSEFGGYSYVANKLVQCALKQNAKKCSRWSRL